MNLPRLFRPANDNFVRAPRPLPKPFTPPVNVIVRSPTYLPAVRMFARFMPWLSAALLAYELWELYMYYKRAAVPEGGTTYVKCRDPEPPKEIRRRWSNNTCKLYQPSGALNWSSTNRWLHSEEQVTAGDWFRSNTIERTFYATDPGPLNPASPPGYFPDIPWPIGVPRMPPWLWPLVPPLSPTYPPVSPPVRWPSPGRPYPPNPEDPLPPNGNTEPWAPPRTVSPTPPRLEPPGSGVKERKGKFLSSRVARTVLGRILGNATEVADFIDALYEALPKELRSNKDTLADKVEKLYTHADKIDLTDAVTNLWNETTMDRGYSQAFDALEKGLRDYGIDVGGLRIGQITPTL